MNGLEDAIFQEIQNLSKQKEADREISSPFYKQNNQYTVNHRNILKGSGYAMAVATSDDNKVERILCRSGNQNVQGDSNLSAKLDEPSSIRVDRSKSNVINLQCLARIDDKKAALILTKDYVEKLEQDGKLAREHYQYQRTSDNKVITRLVINDPEVFKQCIGHGAGASLLKSMVSQIEDDASLSLTTSHACVPGLRSCDNPHMLQLLKDKEFTDIVRSTLRNPPDTYEGQKLKYLLEHEPDSRGKIYDLLLEESAKIYLQRFTEFALVNDGEKVQGHRPIVRFIKPASFNLGKVECDVVQLFGSEKKNLSANIQSKLGDVILDPIRDIIAGSEEAKTLDRSLIDDFASNIKGGNYLIIALARVVQSIRASGGDPRGVRMAELEYSAQHMYPELYFKGLAPYKFVVDKVNKFDPRPGIKKLDSNIDPKIDHAYSEYIKTDADRKKRYKQSLDQHDKQQDNSEKEEYKNIDHRNGEINNDSHPEGMSGEIYEFADTPIPENIKKILDQDDNFLVDVLPTGVEVAHGVFSHKPLEHIVQYSRAIKLGGEGGERYENARFMVTINYERPNDSMWSISVVPKYMTQPERPDIMAERITHRIKNNMFPRLIEDISSLLKDPNIGTSRVKLLKKLLDALESGDDKTVMTSLIFVKGTNSQERFGGRVDITFDQDMLNALPDELRSFVIEQTLDACNMPSQGGMLDSLIGKLKKNKKPHWFSSLLNGIQNTIDMQNSFAVNEVAYAKDQPIAPGLDLNIDTSLPKIAMSRDFSLHNYHNLVISRIKECALYKKILDENKDMLKGLPKDAAEDMELMFVSQAIKMHEKACFRDKFAIWDERCAKAFGSASLSDVQKNKHMLSTYVRLSFEHDMAEKPEQDFHPLKFFSPAAMQGATNTAMDLITKHNLQTLQNFVAEDYPLDKETITAGDLDHAKAVELHSILMETPEGRECLKLLRIDENQKELRILLGAGIMVDSGIVSNMYEAASMAQLDSIRARSQNTSYSANMLSQAAALFQKDTGVKELQKEISQVGGDELRGVVLGKILDHKPQDPSKRFDLAPLRNLGDGNKVGYSEVSNVLQKIMADYKAGVEHKPQAVKIQELPVPPKDSKDLNEYYQKQIEKKQSGHRGCSVLKKLRVSRRI